MASTTRPSGETARLRVLIVEDCRDTADTLAAVLRLWGFDAQAVYGGEAVLAEATAYRPDLALIDLQMPGMDGCQLAARFRESPELRDVLLVALTGYADEELVGSCQHAEFAFCMTRPPSMTMLREFLTALARAKEEHSLRPRPSEDAPTEVNSSPACVAGPAASANPGAPGPPKE